MPSHPAPSGNASHSTPPPREPHDLTSLPLNTTTTCIRLTWAHRTSTEASGSSLSSVHNHVYYGHSIIATRCIGVATLGRPSSKWPGLVYLLLHDEASRSDESLTPKSHALDVCTLDARIGRWLQGQVLILVLAKAHWPEQRLDAVVNQRKLRLEGPT